MWPIPWPPNAECCRDGSAVPQWRTSHRAAVGPTSCAGCSSNRKLRRTDQQPQPWPLGVDIALRASPPSAAAQSPPGPSPAHSEQVRRLSGWFFGCTPTEQSAATLPLLVELHRKAASELGFCVLGVGPWWCGPLDQPPALKHPDQLLDL